MNSGIELGQDSSVKISFRANPKPSVVKWNIDNYRIMLGAGGSSMDSESHFKSRLYLLGFYCDMGAFKNYVDIWGWVGGQSDVYAYKDNDLFLFTSLV